MQKFQKNGTFKFKDFSRTFKGLEFFLQNSRTFKDFSSTLWTLYLRPGVFLVENRPPAAQYATIFIVNVVLSTNKALSQQSDIPDDRSRKHEASLNIPVSQKLLAIHHSLVAYSDKSQVFISCDVAPPSQSYLDLKTNVKVTAIKQNMHEITTDLQQNNCSHQLKVFSSAINNSMLWMW